ncbi:MAG TPA: DNA polymerase III subunit alpha, partial [Sphingomonadales bacterium]|nr:DNA polymerase III subunit alpha [Sphingomonadales bacterium]
MKFDFLGLKTLTVLNRTMDFLREKGIEIDLETLPLNDPKTYRLIARGDTAGVFQLEGSGMRQSLRALKPDKFEDIIAMVALYRPGPMDNIPSYINRKHGIEKVDYLHEWLEPVLEETHGVIIYQEQVMEIAKILAGYSLGEADLLRRAMGKKIQAEMDAQRKRFVEGAKEKGVPEHKASHIFDLVNKFAGYGFNKSHAAAYALVAYQTAYFKANYPVEFMAATMSLERDNTDKLNAHVKEIRAMKIPLYPPDINASEANFSVEGEGGAKGIRYALAAVKNVGAKAMETIVEERKANGPYKNLHEVMERIEITAVNKRQMENLAYAGAFDSLNPNRAQTFAALDMLLKHAHACHEARTSNQAHLFAGEEEAPVPRMPLPEVDPWEPAQALKFERDAIGFYFTSHPLEAYGDLLAKRHVRESAEFMTNPSLVGQTVKGAGIVEDLQERKAAKTGRPFAFLALSDASGSYEALVFGEVLDHLRAAVDEDLPLLLDLSIDKAEGDDTPRLIVRGFELFDPERLARNAELTISLAGEEAVETIKGLLEKHKGGRGVVTVSILAREEEREVQIRLPERVRITPALQGAIKSFPGVSDARVTY